MRFRPNGAQLALCGTTFLMWGGFFMVIPLVTVHYVNDLGWAAASVGTVLAARQLAQQGLTMFGGALADRVGPKPLLLAGFLTRAAGFAAMGFADTFLTLLAASLLAGVGGSLFDAPKSAAASLVTAPGDRAAMFTLLGVIGNLGMVVGPLVGALLVHHDFRTVALVSASSYVVSAAIIALALPAAKGTSLPAEGFGGLRAAARDRRFRRFTTVLVGFFLLNTQINVAVTLRAVDLHGAGATGPLYAVQAGVALVLQWPVLRLAARRLAPATIMVTGVVLTAVALGAISLVTSFAALLACIAVFSLGAMVIVPTQQTLTALFSPPATYGSYFGVGALSLGVGGAVGNLLGGVLVDVGAELDLPSLPWLTLMAIGLVTAAGLRWSLRDAPDAPLDEAAADSGTGHTVAPVPGAGDGGGPPDGSAAVVADRSTGS
jgi:DHA1 family multidrug resistance protein-like MFS transporter